MATGLDLVKSTLRKSGAIGANETPTSDEANDTMETINQMLSSWSNFASNIPARVLENFTLTPGDGEYTIGPSANFNTTRPIKIVAAYYRSDTIDYAMEIVDDETFARIPFKTQQGRPEYLNYDNGFATGTIKLSYVPDQAYTLYLLSEKPLSSLTLAGTVSLPPGWEMAIIYNGAILVAPEYGQPVTADMAEIAAQSKTSIMKAVLRNRTPEVKIRGARSNIYSGLP